MTFSTIVGYCQTPSSFEKLYSNLFDGSAIICNSNSIFIAGKNTANCLIVKTDSSLHPLWNVQIKRPSNGMNIKSLLLSNNNLLFTGYVKDTTQINPSSNPYVLMFGVIDTSTGQLMNSRIIGDTLYSFIYSTSQTTDGNFLAVGQCSFDINNPNPSSEGLIIKFNESLNILWAKRYPIGYTTIFNDAIEITNNYFICGYTEDSLQMRDAVILKIDTAGNFDWCKTLDANYNESANSIIAVNDTIFISGEAEDIQGNVDGYVSAMDTSCNYYWNNMFHSNFPITKNKLLSFNNEFLLLTAGRTVMKLEFDGNLINYNQTYRSYDDAIIQYPFLLAVNAGQLIMTKIDSTLELCFPAPRNIQTIPFSFMNSNVSVIDQQYIYSDLGKAYDSTNVILDSLICETFTGITEYGSNSLIQINPNPARDEIYIELENNINQLPVLNIQILNVLGQQQLNVLGQFSGGEIKINIMDLTQGIYFLFIPDIGIITKFIKL
ncbi:MAG: T9SS type A sorting domain-containing protein [Nitrosopumilus sp.]|nr:T9SS type A sorting domain-containing protein [Nitrosopumilus sp.]